LVDVKENDEGIENFKYILQNKNSKGFYLKVGNFKSDEIMVDTKNNMLSSALKVRMALVDRGLKAAKQANLVDFNDNLLEDLVY